MRKLIFKTCFIALTLGVLSCNSNTSSQQEDTELVKNNETLKSFKTSKKPLDIGKEYTMNGVFSASRGVFFVKNGKIPLTFSVGDEYISLKNINFGEKKSNSIWFPKDFTEQDVKTFDKNKVEGTINDTYKVTFKVTSSKVEEPPKMDGSGFLTKQYEERKAKNELKILSNFEMVEFEKVESLSNNVD